MKFLFKGKTLQIVASLLVVVVGLTGLWVSKATSVEPRNQVIGVVDIGQVISSVIPLRSAYEDFLAADEAYSVRAYYLNNYLQQVSQQYSIELDALEAKDPDYAKKEGEITDKYNKMLEEAGKELELEKYEKNFNVKSLAWQEIYEQMSSVIAKVSQENDVDVVLNSFQRPDEPILQGVFYGGKELTGLVIAALQQELEKGATTTPSNTP